MSEENNHSTEKLPQPDLEARLEALEKIVAALAAEIRAGFQQTNEKLAEISRTQREMSVDLRERLDLISDKTAVMQRTVDQVVRDSRPDSIQNRLLN